MPRKLTQEKFIEKAKKIYPEYDYSKFKYINYKTKGEVICEVHGSFFKTPEKILVQKEKCQKCKAEDCFNLDLETLYGKETDYRKEYLKLIKKISEKGETHHILPKSMFPLWKNKQSNLVKLSFEDHYKAHYLLYKIYNNKEMAMALFFMLKITGKKYNSKLYEELRLKHKEKNQRKIYCYEDDKVFDSLTEAKQHSNSSLDYALRKFSNTACSKHWCYLEDKEKAIEFWKNNFTTIGRMVYCYEDDKVFTTIKEAAINKKCTATKIIKSCKTFKNTSGKCHWCYLEDKEKAIEFWKNNLMENYL